MHVLSAFIPAFGVLFALFFGCSAPRSATLTPNAGPKTFENILIAKSGGRTGLGPCEPAIAINPRNTANLVAGAVLNAHYWSEDGGRSWQSGTLQSTFGVYGDPVVVADTQGYFYYAHLSDSERRGRSGTGWLDRIVVQRSADGGKTYDNGTYAGLRPPKDQDKQWLCVDPRTNAIYMTWTEFDKYGSGDKATDHSRILFSKSTDQGRTWTEALAINEFDGDCEDDDNTPEGAVPAAGPKGEIYVAWSWNNQIWFDRSLDGGKTWLDKDIVAAEQPGGWNFDIPGIQRCNGMPVLVCDLSNGPHRGTLYLNWADQRRGVDDTDIWLAKSTDGGNTWSKPTRVNNDGKGKHQFLTWLAIDQTTGYLYAVFYDRRAYNDERTDVYLAVSRDGGKKFENLKITPEPFDPSRLTFFGDYNHIAAYAGVVRPIWTRLEKGELSVWTALINFHDR